MVAWLEQGGQVDARCAEAGSVTLLMGAAHAGQTPLVRLLLQRKASLDLQDDLGNTALMVAAGCGLIALMLAALNGQTATVQVLLEVGADASLRDVDGLTALQWAEHKKHAATARLLRQHAAKPSHRLPRRPPPPPPPPRGRQTSCWQRRRPRLRPKERARPKERPMPRQRARPRRRPKGSARPRVAPRVSLRVSSRGARQLRKSRP